MDAVGVASRTLSSVTTGLLMLLKGRIDVPSAQGSCDVGNGVAGTVVMDEDGVASGTSVAEGAAVVAAVFAEALLLAAPPLLLVLKLKEMLVQVYL